MKKNNDNLIMLNGLFLVSLVISNVVASKIVNIFGLTVPAAVVAYPITFLMTDIIGEIWGKEEANKTVKRGLILQIFSSFLILLAINLPIVSFTNDFQTQFQSVLGNNIRFTIASLVAYVLSQANDVYIFHKLKEKCNRKQKWLRNNLSTLLSQLIDTSIFITIGFWGQVPNLIHMIFSQYIIKAILALFDTPFFYYFTREKQRRYKDV